MTNNERIKTLRKMRDSGEIMFTSAELESLNWAIKTCQKVESRNKAKRKSYCSWMA